ncbi:MAG: hypothetical protein ACLVJ4_13190 [Mediterraneibacter sp.]
MKKGWMILGAVSALISGMLIYEGAVLFLRYTDRRMGLLIAVSGAAVAVLFVFCIFESFSRGFRNKNGTDDNAGRSEEDLEGIIKGLRTEFLLTCVSFGCAGVGALLYRLRFHMIFQIYLYTLLFVAVVLIIAAAGVFRLMSGRVREREFRDRILSEKNEWKEKGYVSWNKTAGDLFEIIAEGKLVILQIWGAGAILLVWLLLDCIRTGRMGMVLAGAVIYIILNLAVQTVSLLKGAKRVFEVLGQGDTKTVLGFFTAYYEQASGRVFSLPAQMQEYAVAALCDQEAYREALDLLGTIRRKPKMEAYFQQYAWLCFQGMGDMQGCRSALENMKASMRYLKGKNLEAVQQLVQLFQNYMDGNSSELIRAAQDESRTVLQKRTRQRLADSAMKEQKNERQLIEEGEVCDDGKQ